MEDNSKWPSSLTNVLYVVQARAYHSPLYVNVVSRKRGYLVSEFEKVARGLLEEFYEENKNTPTHIARSHLRIIKFTMEGK